MPKPARHVAANTTTDQCAPEKRDGQAGCKMDERHQTNMEDRQ